MLLYDFLRVLDTTFPIYRANLALDGGVVMRFVQKLAAFGAAGLLVGCNGGDGDNYRAYIAPLDGQTAVATDLPLFVEIGDISMPPDLPIPEDFIRVVDLVDGGTVAGELVRDDTRVDFVPSVPWSEAGTRGVCCRLSVTLGPQFQFPAHLLGTAVFDCARMNYRHGFRCA